MIGVYVGRVSLGVCIIPRICDSARLSSWNMALYGTRKVQIVSVDIRDLNG